MSLLVFGLGLAVLGLFVLSIALALAVAILKGVIKIIARLF